MLPVIELFTNIQGEGMYMGVPSHFVRVSGCNLRCIFKNSLCDTPYASFSPEKTGYKSMDQLVETFKEQQKKFPKVHHVVITGGEPLLYKKDLEEFLGRIFDWEMKITIETNGTLPPLNPLGRFMVHLYSVSPKLKTSVGKPGDYDGVHVSDDMIGHHDGTRLNYENLVRIATSASNYQFKFVYSGPECIEEIEDIYRQMAEVVKKEDEFIQGFYMRNHPNHNTMLMCEGITPQQLDENMSRAIDICNQRGWRYTDRLHIRAHGNARNV